MNSSPNSSGFDSVQLLQPKITHGNTRIIIGTPRTYSEH